MGEEELEMMASMAPKAIGKRKLSSTGKTTSTVSQILDRHGFLARLSGMMMSLARGICGDMVGP